MRWIRACPNGCRQRNVVLSELWRTGHRWSGGATFSTPDAYSRIHALRGLGKTSSAPCLGALSFTPNEAEPKP